MVKLYAVGFGCKQPNTKIFIGDFSTLEDAAKELEEMDRNGGFSCMEGAEAIAVVGEKQLVYIDDWEDNGMEAKELDNIPNSYTLEEWMNQK